MKDNMNHNNDDDFNNEEEVETLNINQVNENINPKSINKSAGSKEKKLFDFFCNNDNNIQNNYQIKVDAIINDEKITNIKKVIILISSILTIKKILKRLISFSSKIELEVELYEVFSKINKYEKLIEQIQNLFYLEIISNIFDFSQISILIMNYDWSPSSEEGSQKLFEASDWVNKLKIYFENFVSEIYNKLSFSNIQKCNDMGRSIMLKDIKLLKEEFEKILKKYRLDKKIKIDNIFDVIIQFVNAWYYNTDELYQYIFNYNLDYKYFENIVNSSPIIQKLAFVNKNDFLKKVKQNYLNKIIKIVSDLN